MKAVLSFLIFLALATPVLADEAKTAEKSAVTEAEKKRSAEIVANANADKMSTFTYVVGGIIGTYPGFGLGHVVQGRWKERGWVFTTGESASALVFIIGAAQCLGDIIGETIEQRERRCRGGLMQLGAISFFVFKIWEIVDVWATPLTNNMVAFNIAPPTEERPTIFSIALRY